MKIAVVGWGSLIWCPGTLSIKTRWRLDGPRLPIEFARVSRDGRLTLVILPGSEHQSTYWAISALTMLTEARRDLCKREDARLKDIHYLTRNGEATGTSPSEIVSGMRDWLAIREDLDAVIWTGLGSNWKRKRGRDFTLEDAVNYLVELEAARNHAAAAYDRAREYVTNAPPHIQTVVRNAMRARGWVDAQLAEVLFEA